ncbi:unnamed protein product [Vitrella brassicaformis CCMP3155]|uniref:Uncharacterized protein n=2 Tax=Vitrella brassicaformis TaxID=1169539 RepID=A0A0G4EYV4_VITBC|nr:unnamed protein product [Vitrella brassicaformis CCMP3155]|eukprot:CEM04126.1 unnamed protein product [Vitrella brassicaformis CCMP3155]
MSAAFGFDGPHATSTAKSSSTSLPRRSVAHRQPHRHHQSYARRTVRTPAAAASPDARPDGPPSPSQSRPGAAIPSSEDGNVSLQAAVAQWQAAGLSVGIFNRTTGLTTNLPPVPPTPPPPLPMGTIPSDSPNRTVYRVKAKRGLDGRRYEACLHQDGRSLLDPHGDVIMLPEEGEQSGWMNLELEGEDEGGRMVDPHVQPVGHVRHSRHSWRRVVRREAWSVEKLLSLMFM